MNSELCQSRCSYLSVDYFFWNSLFFIIGVFVTNYIVYSVFDNIINKSEVTHVLLNKFNPYDFNFVWQTVSYTSGFILILPVLLLIILVTNEFAFKTSRQNIIDGWSRLQFVNVKIMLALIVSVISTLLVIITALVFAYTTGTHFSTDGFSHVGYFFLKSFSYNLIAIFISVLLRRTGFAIGIFFIYMGTENIIAQLLDVLSIKIRLNTGVDLGSMGDYLPMNASDGLLSFPRNPLKSMTSAILPTDYTSLVICIAIFYMILFYWMCRRNILKKDL